MASNKSMASALNESLEYRHSGRTWRKTPFNVLKDVKITSQQDVSSSWQHMVFTLDKKYLRKSAIGFDQFNKDTQGMAMLKAFSFFIKTCYNISNDGTNADGQGSAIFLEWVKSATIHNKHVGIRVHFFSNRTGNKSNAYNTVSKMIFTNAQDSNKTNRMFLKNR